MKLTPVYHPPEEFLLLQMDVEAQDALAKSAVILEAFCNNPEVRLLAASSRQDLRPKLAAGLEILSQLASTESRQIELRVEALQVALEATLLASNYLAGRGLKLATLPQTVLLLAGVTPYPLPRLSLPPAVEVFDRGKLSEGAWKGYEVIRLWSPPGHPHLFLIHIRELWEALKSMPRTNDPLRKLVTCSEASTRFFRDVMSRLALAEIVSRQAPPPKRKRKNP